MHLLLQIVPFFLSQERKKPVLDFFEAFKNEGAVGSSQHVNILKRFAFELALNVIIGLFKQSGKS
jgi:hypothetical protein